MVFREFVNPPEKYGEVSFFWWHGDKIEKEKLHWILEQLKDKGIAGIQLNYCHSDKGGLQYGLTMDWMPPSLYFRMVGTAWLAAGGMPEGSYGFQSQRLYPGSTRTGELYG